MNGKFNLKKIMLKQSGFSLTELLIVIAIVAVLGAVGIPAFQKYKAMGVVTQGKTLVTTAYTQFVTMQARDDTKDDFSFNDFKKVLKAIDLGSGYECVQLTYKPYPKPVEESEDESEPEEPEETQAQTISIVASKSGESIVCPSVKAACQKAENDGDFMIVAVGKEDEHTVTIDQDREMIIVGQDSGEVNCQ